MKVLKRTILDFGMYTTVQTNIIPCIELILGLQIEVLLNIHRLERSFERVIRYADILMFQHLIHPHTGILPTLFAHILYENFIIILSFVLKDDILKRSQICSDQMHFRFDL